MIGTTVNIIFNFVFRKQQGTLTTSTLLTDSPLRYLDETRARLAHSILHALKGTIRYGISKLVERELAIPRLTNH